MPYKVIVLSSGVFSITNTKRDKTVLTGQDDLLKARGGDTYKYDDVRDLLSGISRLVSVGTLRKISKKLAAW